ncbi:MAG: hypothetical protein ABGW96_01015 [Methylophilaceae bacterium]|jgi:uncharacterized membrane protein AbrB (regulator of aidB expression)|nr:hypothetical protein [Methylophilaceae bacterium]
MTKSKVKTNTQNAGHLLAIFSWVIIFIIGTVLLSVLVVDMLGVELEHPDSYFWPTMAVCIGFVIALLVTARGLRFHKQWARHLGFVLAVIVLAAFPVGTVLGLFILSNIIKGWKET